jgi:hypothetical protein
MTLERLGFIGLRISLEPGSVDRHYPDNSKIEH